MRHRCGWAGKERRDLGVDVYGAQLLQPVDVICVDDGAGSGNPSRSRPNSAVTHWNHIVKAGTVEIDGDDVKAIGPIDQCGEGRLRNDAEMNDCGGAARASG